MNGRANILRQALVGREAAIDELPSGTVRSRLHAARRRLLEAMR